MRCVGSDTLSLLARTPPLHGGLAAIEKNRHRFRQTRAPTSARGQAVPEAVPEPVPDDPQQTPSPWPAAGSTCSLRAWMG